MSENRSPAHPLAAYKELIDQLASETSHGVTERIVLEKGAFLERSDDAVYNTLLKSLTIEEKGMLARLIHNERISAIHDVLALLTWWINARGLGFTFRGDAMPFDLSGMGLHGDYVGRLDGWNWPDQTA